MRPQFVYCVITVVSAARHSSRWDHSLCLLWLLLFQLPDLAVDGTTVYVYCVITVVSAARPSSR